MSCFLSPFIGTTPPTTQSHTNQWLLRFHSLPTINASPIPNVHLDALPQRSPSTNGNDCLLANNSPLTKSRARWTTARPLSRADQSGGATGPPASFGLSGFIKGSSAVPSQIKGKAFTVGLQHRSWPGKTHSPFELLLIYELWGFIQSEIE